MCGGGKLPSVYISMGIASPLILSLSVSAISIYKLHRVCLFIMPTTFHPRSLTVVEALSIYPMGFPFEGA